MGIFKAPHIRMRGRDGYPPRRNRGRASRSAPGLLPRAERTHERWYDSRGDQFVDEGRREEVVEGSQDPSGVLSLELGNGDRVKWTATRSDRHRRSRRAMLAWASVRECLPESG
jgi:hypothetical protein